MTQNRAPAPWRVQVLLQPRASRNRIVSRHGDAIKIQVHSPPVEGAANAALVELLATTLAVPRSAIRIVRGASSRTKLVEIRSNDVAGCQRRLEEALHRVDKPAASD